MPPDHPGDYFLCRLRGRDVAAIVSQHGAPAPPQAAWAMSALNTDDPEAAKRFYSDVFGWGTKGFDMGGAEMVMWTVPGYVGGEPEQPVPRDVVANHAAAERRWRRPSPLERGLLGRERRRRRGDRR